MLDIETMGNGSQAAIIAIGAAAFDLNGVHAKFYAQCSLESSVDAGLVMDPSTVIWWLKQSDQARAAFADNDAAPHLAIALSDFAQFCRDVGVDQVWGNGASFDNVVLGNAYKRNYLPIPWGRADRCYRTIKSLYPAVKLVRTGTHHNAVDDAESQAVHLIDICKTYGVTL